MKYPNPNPNPLRRSRPLLCFPDTLKKTQTNKDSPRQWSDDSAFGVIRFTHEPGIPVSSSLRRSGSNISPIFLPSLHMGANLCILSGSDRVVRRSIACRYLPSVNLVLLQEDAHHSQQPRQLALLVTFSHPTLDPRQFYRVHLPLIMQKTSHFRY